MKHLTRMTFVALLLFAGVSVAGEMSPLDDDALGNITGAEGVQLTLRLRNNVDESGGPIGCSGLLNPCRMGLEFSGRDGIWLMLKDYYGVLEVNDIRLDGSDLPATNTSYWNSERFKGTDGSCLLVGCNPAGLTAVKISYPFNKDPAQYEDVKLFLNIGRVALEFDQAATPGYLRDAASGSVLGFRASDSTALNSAASFRLDGEAYVFGF